MRFALSPVALGDRGARRAIVDPAQRMPGRGAYVCARAGRAGDPAPDCLRRALARGGLSRSLRTTVTVDPEFVESTRT